jgi:hypothetical protein
MDLPNRLAHNVIELKRTVTIPMSVATHGGADEVNAELVNQFGNFYQQHRYMYC